MAYKLKCDTIQNFEKLTYNFKKCETWNKIMENKKNLKNATIWNNNNSRI